MSQLRLRASIGLDLGVRRAEQLAVDRVRQGDALALEMIFVAYRVELIAVAERIVGSRAVAEEVVQDVFLAIWTGRAGWHITKSLGAYLRQATHNVAARARTSRTRGISTELELEVAERKVEGGFVDASPPPDVIAERGELAAAVEAATKTMPPRAREVFALSRESFLTNGEIASVLGLSVKTVETHMTRAFAFLRKRLSHWRR